MHDIGNQGHPRSMQLCLCIQYTGVCRATRSLGVSEQPQVPAHVDAGVKVGVHRRNILQRSGPRAHHWHKRRIGRASQQALLLEPEHGLSHIQVLCQRLIHQCIQGRIVPGTPPLGQLSLPCSCRRLLPLGGCCLVQLDSHRRSTSRQQ